MIKYLIEHGADINKENNNGGTPLMFASKNENKTLIKYLVDHGANVNIKLDNGKTILFNPCELGNKTLVKYLVKHGADVNRKISTQGDTPLIISCKYGKIKYLIEQGRGRYK